MVSGKLAMPPFLEAVRDGKALAETDIRLFIESLPDCPDEQVSAFLAHAYHKPLSPENTVHLTLAMRDSGDVLDWSGFDKPVADKHSTGGVGDKITICLAPLLAALGMAVPTIAGRALGFSGGTVDKLETIPGLSLALDKAAMEKQTRELGLAFGSQTASIAPADKKLYALRDVTATVESVPLITASILSKKLAESLDFLVMDVKWGSGAFMRTAERARELARSIVTVAEGAGVKTRALVTDMNQPTGAVSGNWSEVAEAVNILKNDAFTLKTAPDTRILTLTLAATLLVMTRLAPDFDAAMTRAEQELASGRPFEIFCRVIAAQDGLASLFERPFPTLKGTEHRFEVKAANGGYLRSIDVKALGTALGLAGAGRQTQSDRIDPDVSLHHPVKIGDAVQKGETLATLYYNDDRHAGTLQPLLQNAFVCGPEPAAAPPLVREVIAL